MDRHPQERRRSRLAIDVQLVFHDEKRRRDPPLVRGAEQPRRQPAVDARDLSPTTPHRSFATRLIGARSLWRVEYAKLTAGAHGRYQETRAGA